VPRAVFGQTRHGRATIGPEQRGDVVHHQRPAKRRGYCRLAMGIGAKTRHAMKTWWMPSVFIANGGTTAASLGSGRQRPGAISRFGGRRFCKRANSYVEVRQVDVRKQGGCRAGWSSTPDTVRRYVAGANRSSRGGRYERMIARWSVTPPDTSGDLARQIDVRR